MKKFVKFFFTVISLVLVLQGCKSCKVSDEKVKASMTALINVNLVPMTNGKIVENQTVLVEGTRIITIGSSNKVKIPQNANVINGAAAYLMPGLADMHMHIKDDWSKWPVFPLYLFLANGVTTIRDFGPIPGSGSSIANALQFALKLRDEVNEGKRTGPTIYTCGLRPGHSDAGDKDSRQIVRKNHAQGFDFLKIYSFLSKEDYQKALAVAKELSIYTTGHIPYTVGLDGVLSEGMDEIAHIEELDWELYDINRNQNLTEQGWVNYIFFNTMVQQPRSFNFDFDAFAEQKREIISQTVKKLQSANISVCTTLDISEVIVLKILEPETFMERPELAYLPKYYLDALSQGKDKHQMFAKVIGEGNEGLPIFKYKMDSMWLTELKDAGITLLLGTDAGSAELGLVPGFSIHDELRILTENGFTPYEAIATGTIYASKIIEAMTGKDDFGSIEVGKRADLILVNKNPLEDIANIKDYRGVMAAGKWYSREALKKMITPDLRDSLKPGSKYLLKIIEEKGVTAAVEQYQKEKKEAPNLRRIDIGEDEINRLGYDLIKRGRIKEAIVIFILNVTEYPDSSNVYDSLGEAYMLYGKKDLAIKNFEKSLKIYPANKYVKDMLIKLNKEIK